MHSNSNMYEETTFTRDCEVVVIPDGYETTIPEGAIGFITQILGGNFTVQMTNGYLVRVSGQDAEANALLDISRVGGHGSALSRFSAATTLTQKQCKFVFPITARRASLVKNAWLTTKA